MELHSTNLALASIQINDFRLTDLYDVDFCFRSAAHGNILAEIGTRVWRNPCRDTTQRALQSETEVRKAHQRARWKRSDRCYVAFEVRHS